MTRLTFGDPTVGTHNISTDRAPAPQAGPADPSAGPTGGPTAGSPGARPAARDPAGGRPARPGARSPARRSGTAGARARTSGAAPTIADAVRESRLTPRDRRVLALLAEHQTMTATQLGRLAFPSHAAASNRLATLARRDILQRFRNHPGPGGGSEPFVYCLGWLGAATLAATAERPIPTRTEIHTRALRLRWSPRLAHALGVTDFVSRLGDHTTPHPGRLTHWLTEPDATRVCGALVRPDGGGEWTESGARVGFWFEHDRGTEPLRRLLGQIDRYAAVAHVLRSRVLVLIELPSLARETNLHRAIRRAGPPPGVLIATTTRDHPGADIPAGPIWRLAPAGPRDRLSLISLGGPARLAPHNPAPTQP